MNKSDYTLSQKEYTRVDKYLLKRMPFLKGKQHKVIQMIQETQGTIEGRCFV